MNSGNFNTEIEKCETLIASKSFRKADEAISNAIQINRDSPYAWHLKAKVSLGLLDYKKALRASKKAIELNPKNEYIEFKENIENFINLDADDLTAEYSNRMDNMAVFTSAKNIKLLSERKLNQIVYNRILDDIKEDVAKNTPNGDEIYLNVRKLTESFIDLEFLAHSSNDTTRRVAGAYGFKRAVIDSSLSKTLQIAAMIHELTHHLLFEIFKNTLMYIYQSQETDTIEAFAWYSLTGNVYWLLMNEYCAHTVECHYMKLKNYESFNNILNENLDEEKVKKAVELGNCLAEDIIYMLDEFFTPESVEEIKMQFLSDRVILLKKGCEFKSEMELSGEEKFNMINSVLRETLIYIKIHFSYGELNQFRKIFADYRG
jgi:tetratricopeptide (TPR) repeat protein